ncbi:hypothetical protein [uncultured Aquimarina sp.]|uniref:hypothetical protein n=1 Tax=uncultured Aquimarina sp. TaxID=575652 RepID=UPI0026190A94|nr:hypothetical protein [uncultured Aquimarina sp.]
MLKNISDLGKELKKKEQKNILGGKAAPVECSTLAYECDACHPEDYNAFSACLNDLSNGQC